MSIFTRDESPSIYLEKPVGPSRHRVLLTGPFSGGDFDMLDHGDHCQGGECGVMQNMFEFRDKHGAWQVQGEYFTFDGKSFERCAWQPDRR